MQAFFTDYLNIMQDNHNEIFEALEGLPSAALDWTPGPDMNSISAGFPSHRRGALLDRRRGGAGS